MGIGTTILISFALTLIGAMAFLAITILVATKWWRRHERLIGVTAAVQPVARVRPVTTTPPTPAKPAEKKKGGSKLVWLVLIAGVGYFFIWRYPPNEIKSLATWALQEIAVPKVPAKSPVSVGPKPKQSDFYDFPKLEDLSGVKSFTLEIGPEWSRVITSKEIPANHRWRVEAIDGDPEKEFACKVGIEDPSDNRDHTRAFISANGSADKFKLRIRSLTGKRFGVKVSYWPKKQNRR